MVRGLKFISTEYSPVSKAAKISSALEKRLQWLHISQELTNIGSFSPLEEERWWPLGPSQEKAETYFD